MPFNNRTRDILTIATQVLRGSIDDARGRHDAAAAAFERAVAIQDNLHYGEPPDWYFPVR